MYSKEKLMFVAIVNATMTVSEHKTDEKHEKHRKIVKKDMKDVQDEDDDKTKQHVKIKKKERVSGPSEGTHKVKVEKDENGKVIPHSFSKKIAKKDLKNKQSK